mgnify:CR=1 FL=1
MAAVTAIATAAANTVAMAGGRKSRPLVWREEKAKGAEEST